MGSGPVTGAGGREGAPGPTLPVELPAPTGPPAGRRRPPARTGTSAGQRVRLRWEKLGPAALETQGTAFCDWVLWLVETYALWEVWPVCWHQHPGLVEELTALWAWHLALDTESGGEGAAAVSWHAALWRFIDRSLPMVSRRCLSSHAELPADVAGAHRKAEETMRASFSAALARHVWKGGDGVPTSDPANSRPNAPAAPAP